MSAPHLIKNLKLKIKNSLRSRGYGFTLIELMITISIIAILAAIGITTYSQSQKLARDARRKQDLRSVAVALELFYQQNRRFPCGDATWQNSSTANWLVDKAPASSTQIGCPGTGIAFAPGFINRIPTDPINTGSASPSIGTATNYVYGYWQGTCSGTSHYALIALLENTSDPDSVSKKVQTWCDGSSLASAGANWNVNTFMVSSW